MYDAPKISLNWNTSFPAVTVCEIFNGEKNWDLSERYKQFKIFYTHTAYFYFYFSFDNIKLIKRYYGSNRNNKLDDFLSDITFFNGKCYACALCEKEMVCPNNFTDISLKV